MKYGDLSNRPAPRILLVFDDAVGYVPDEDIKQFDKLIGRKKFREASYLIKPHELMFRRLLDITWRKNINVHLVTWMGHNMAAEIENWMDEAMIPIRGCFSVSPEELARYLPYNPDVVAVYDPDPAHIFTYGGKGVLLSNPEQIGAML